MHDFHDRRKAGVARAGLRLALALAFALVFGLGASCTQPPDVSIAPQGSGYVATLSSGFAIYAGPDPGAALRAAIDHFARDGEMRQTAPVRIRLEAGTYRYTETVPIYYPGPEEQGGFEVFGDGEVVVILSEQAPRFLDAARRPLIQDGAVFRGLTLRNLEVRQNQLAGFNHVVFGNNLDDHSQDRVSFVDMNFQDIRVRDCRVDTRSKAESDAWLFAIRMTTVSVGNDDPFALELSDLHFEGIDVEGCNGAVLVTAHSRQAPVGLQTPNVEIGPVSIVDSRHDTGVGMYPSLQGATSFQIGSYGKGRGPVVFENNVSVAPGDNCFEVNGIESYRGVGNTCVNPTAVGITFVNHQMPDRPLLQLAHETGFRLVVNQDPPTPEKAAGVSVQARSDGRFFGRVLLDDVGCTYQDIDSRRVNQCIEAWYPGNGGSVREVRVRGGFAHYFLRHEAASNAIVNAIEARMPLFDFDDNGSLDQPLFAFEDLDVRIEVDHQSDSVLVARSLFASRGAHLQIDGMTSHFEVTRGRPAAHHALILGDEAGSVIDGEILNVEQTVSCGGTTCGGALDVAAFAEIAGTQTLQIPGALVFDGIDTSGVDAVNSSEFGFAEPSNESSVHFGAPPDDEDVRIEALGIEIRATRLADGAVIYSGDDLGAALQAAIDLYAEDRVMTHVADVKVRIRPGSYSYRDVVPTYYRGASSQGRFEIDGTGALVRLSEDAPRFLDTDRHPQAPDYSRFQNLTLRGVTVDQNDMPGYGHVVFGNNFDDVSESRYSFTDLVFENVTVSNCHLDVRNKGDGNAWLIGIRLSSDSIGDDDPQTTLQRDIVIDGLRVFGCNGALLITSRVPGGGIEEPNTEIGRIEVRNSVYDSGVPIFPIFQGSSGFQIGSFGHGPGPVIFENNLAIAPGDNCFEFNGIQTYVGRDNTCHNPTALGITFANHQMPPDALTQTASETNFTWTLDADPPLPHKPNAIAVQPHSGGRFFGNVSVDGITCITRNVDSFHLNQCIEAWYPGDDDSSIVSLEMRDVTVVLEDIRHQGQQKWHNAFEARLPLFDFDDDGELEQARVLLHDATVSMDIDHSSDEPFNGRVFYASGGVDLDIRNLSSSFQTTADQPTSHRVLYLGEEPGSAISGVISGVTQDVGCTGSPCGDTYIRSLLAEFGSADTLEIPGQLVLENLDTSGDGSADDRDIIFNAPSIEGEILIDP